MRVGSIFTQMIIIYRCNVDISISSKVYHGIMLINQDTHLPLEYVERMSNIAICVQEIGQCNRKNILSQQNNARSYDTGAFQHALRDVRQLP